MHIAYIDDGESINIDRAITATHKKIVVPRMGEDFTLKRLQVLNGRIFFHKSEYPAHPAIEISSRTDSEIWNASHTSTID